MPKTTVKQAEPGITLGDIVYVLSKHKGKIILFSLLSLGAAAAYYLKAPVLYTSEASLLVRYVVDRSAIDQVDTTATPGGARGVDTVMASQLAILTSWDLARQVESSLTEDLRKRLVPAAGGVNAAGAATGAIYGGLSASTGRGSSVIQLAFKHRDPLVSTQVLDEVIQQYLKKHLEIYRSAKAAKVVIDKVTRAATSLKTAELTLRDLRKARGITSLTEAMGSLSNEMAKGRDELADAETRLAEQQARVATLERLLKGAAGSAAAPAAGPTSLPEPGAAPGAEAASTAPAVTLGSVPASVDRRVVLKYQILLSRLAALRTTHVGLLARFTPENEAVKLNESQMEQLENEQRALEKAHPELVAASQVAAAGAGPRLDLLSEQTVLASLEARVEALRGRLKELLTQVEALSEAAPALSEAERTREIEDGNYKYLRTSQEKALIDQTLNEDSTAPNISIIQAATPARQDVALRDKIALGIAGGGPASTVGLVLLFGLLFNRTIKRPAEFEDKLGFPLMMAIPYFKSLQNGKEAPRLNGPVAESTKKLAAPEDAPPPWDPGHSIRPHAEAIRDRLGLYFEINDLHHKPKLIGVTGQSRGAGASTIASGIAAALSETGDGKVLLVDMGGTSGAAHPFFDGRPAPSLSTAIRSSREADAAAENLFLARADGTVAAGSSIGASRLSRLMPDLKASYFDYVIFDMPALGNTSPTPAMAAFMDQMLVVVEAETSTREEILRQHRDLEASHAKISMVLNKVRPHGPKSLLGSL